MYISSKASLSLAQLFKKQHRKLLCPLPFPLNHNNVVYYFSGRYALSAGIKALGLRNEDVVLLPAYNCWVEIEAILSLGIKIIYYKINKDLTVNINHLEKQLCHSPKAILVTHYMGFPQDINTIKKICLKYSIKLIEDCAHSFLTSYQNKPLGSFGDISIFSFRKSLPIPNGAALVINDEKIKLFNQSLKEPNIFSESYVIAEQLNFKTTQYKSPTNTFLNYIITKSIYSFIYSLRLLLRIHRKATNGRGLYLVYPSGNHYFKDLANWGISPVSFKLILSANFKSIKNKRINNFNYLLNYFKVKKNVILPIKQLPEGVCPLFFPIIIKNRDLVFKKLKKVGIAGHDWWGDFHPNVPWKDFDDSVYLKKNIIGLPVHQDLTMYHLEKICEGFEKVYNS